LSHPAVATTLVGFRSVEEIDDALRALEDLHSPKLMQEIMAIVEPIKNSTWASGLAENQPASHSTAL